VDGICFVSCWCVPLFQSIHQGFSGLYCFSPSEEADARSVENTSPMFMPVFAVITPFACSIKIRVSSARWTCWVRV